jgi:dihydroorotate dehydrogenase electron transfer subunit
MKTASHGVAMQRASGHPPFCADAAVQVTLPVQEMEQVARDTFRIRIAAREIAERVIPGQFVMVRLADGSDPLIGRALAVFDVICDDEGTPIGIDLVFVRKGKFTTALVARGQGAVVTVWGPLGNGFSCDPCDTLLIAVGGIGQTPMLALASEALGQRKFGKPVRNAGYARRVIMVYGARSGDLLASLDQFRATGMELVLCTDDGSVGQRGRVPDILAELLDRVGTADVRVVCCGPEIMMEKVSELAIARGVPCQVSLETPMACGIGVCFTCVAKVRQSDGDWDYKRTCVEGPIFAASDIVWD